MKSIYLKAFNSSRNEKMQLGDKNYKQSHRLKGQQDPLSPLPEYDTQLDVPPISGQPGYSKAKKILNEMTKAGYEDLDILVKLGEEFEPQLLSRIISDFRKKGWL